MMLVKALKWGDCLVLVRRETVRAEVRGGGLSLSRTVEGSLSV